VREVHIVGGLHPDLPFAYFTDMMRGIKAVRPDIHIKAFTAVEIFFFHRLYRMSVEQVLQELKAAGLDSMPGGGAEIFAKETRNKIIKGKADGPQWLDVMRKAAPARDPDQRDDALRARRVGRGPRRPPAEAARAAGRDRAAS
jgi:aminodeoxyfutalosine synthase